MDKEILYAVWAQLVLGAGSVHTGRILEELQSFEQFYRMDETERRNLLPLRDHEIKRIKSIPLKSAETILERCAKMDGCRLLTAFDPDYPERLRNIYSPPAVLYARGDLSCLRGRLVIGMVGTRNCSEYGRFAAERISAGLGKLDAVVVSGLAVGIDAACHRGAIRGGGKTVAVQANGLDIKYPCPNLELREEIVSHGLLLTEYPPGTPPYAGNFPVRNRLISGLSDGVVVVEAGARSGALITADAALDQGKDVFVVPAGIDTVKGLTALRLMRQGAVPVGGAEDILEEYHLEWAARAASDDEKPAAPQERRHSGMPRRESVPEHSAGPEVTEQDAGTPRYLAENLDSLQLAVCEGLAGGVQYPSELSALTGAAAGDLIAVLTDLEMMGLVEARAGGRFFLNSRR